MTTRHRLLALGGVLGPLVFVSGWVFAGAATPGYSPVDDAISDLAAVGASTRVVMTIGFVGFGCGLIAFGAALREIRFGRAWIAAVATGGATLGVAAFPLGGWPGGDGVHATFAGLGYATLVALPWLAARPLALLGKRGWAGASILTSAVAAAFLLASTLETDHGLWQRLGLTVGDTWIVITATAIVVAGWARDDDHAPVATPEPREPWALTLAGLLALTGVLHFVTPGTFDAIVPGVLPGSSRSWTLVSGGVEIGLALGLLSPVTRRVAATSTAAFLVLVFPANVKMAVDWAGRPPAELVIALLRLPLQLPLIWWAWSARRRAVP